MRQFRKLIAIAVAAASVLGARADAVSSDLALAAANAWVAANPGFGARGAAVSAEAEYDGATLMWWVVRLADGGAVFVAPETSIDPVLAAVPRYGGALPAAHPLRAILSTDVANRRRVIAEASATPRARGSSVSRGVVTNAAIAAVVSAAETRWTKLTTARPRARAVTPTANVVVVPGFGDEADNAYLRFWNQEDYSGFSDLRSNAHFDPCFNLYTPLSAYTGKHAVCGCVATAGAALLQYFGATGLTVNVTRECTMDGPTVKLTTISATNHYDWAILPQEIGGEEPMTMLELQQAAEAEASGAGEGEGEGEGEGGGEGEATKKFNAVKELLGRATYDVGVCVQMEYASDESGATLKNLAKALKDDFGFSQARYVEIGTNSDFSGVFSNLRRANPVALGIRNTATRAGHAILAVGYGEDDEAMAYTRLFMGWGGSNDAWYNLPDIQAGTHVFDVVEDAIVSISLDPPIGHRTLEAARAAALESKKPILLISGTSGEPATDDLIDTVQNDFDGEFEIYFADYVADAHADQNPSYGVFNPLVFNKDVDNYWAFYNGSLAYGTDTNTTVFAETLTEGLDAWDDVYDEHLRLLDAAQNGIVVATTNAVLYFNEKILDQKVMSGYQDAFIVMPDYAVWDGEIYFTDKSWAGERYANAYADGETVTLQAPEAVTNVTDRIALTCVGWLVETYGANGWEEVDSGEGNEASFVVAADTSYRVKWFWNPSAVLIKVWAAQDGLGRVVPNGQDGIWCAYGEELSVVAVPKNVNGKPKFEEWVEGSAHNEWLDGTNDCEMAGSVITIPADWPRDIAAHFIKNPGDVAGWTDKFTLEIASSPEEIAAPPSPFGYGTQEVLSGPSGVTVPATWTDATGGVWQCTGWTGTGSVPTSGTTAAAGFDLTEDSSITWLWEPVPPEEPVTPPDPPIGPVEGGVTNSALVIYVTNDTQLAVQTRISNAAAGYWYSIWSADEVAGPYAFVSGTYEGTAKQKVEDPVPELLVLTIVFDPVEAAKFYRVVVTEEEPEN